MNDIINGVLWVMAFIAVIAIIVLSGCTNTAHSPGDRSVPRTYVLYGWDKTAQRHPVAAFNSMEDCRARLSGFEDWNPDARFLCLGEKI